MTGNSRLPKGFKIRFKQGQEDPNIPKKVLRYFLAELRNPSNEVVASLSGYIFDDYQCSLAGEDPYFALDAISSYLAESTEAIYRPGGEFRFEFTIGQVYILEFLKYEECVSEELAKSFTRKAIKHYLGNYSDQVAIVAPGWDFKKKGLLTSEETERLFWRELDFKPIKNSDWLYYWPEEINNPFAARKVIDERYLPQ